ncbi:MAG: cupin [Chromatiales bacterium]|nr:cupin [Chromatiales bacterium]
MSRLAIYKQNNPDSPSRVFDQGDTIAEELAAIGVRFERWEAASEIAPGADQQTILNAYREQVDHLKHENGFATADVISLTANHPDKDALRRKFLSEHIHSEDEVRFFVRGSGLFYLHVGESVYQVLCEKNDLISVPANTPHWFDMGPAPEFTCIRLFTNPEGWVATFSGDPIADGFPRFESLAA